MSRAQTKKEQRKGKPRKRTRRLPRKTIMRPHYIILSEGDTRTFLSEESKVPRAPHPVRGHWRNLRSPKYIRKQGQRIYIKQYFTGEGNNQGENGWHYQVMVKEGLDKVVAYKS